MTNNNGIGIEIDCLMLLDEIGCDQNEIDLIWADSQDLTELITPHKDESNTND